MMQQFYLLRTFSLARKGPGRMHRTIKWLASLLAPGAILS